MYLNFSYSCVRILSLTWNCSNRQRNPKGSRVCGAAPYPGKWLVPLWGTGTATDSAEGTAMLRHRCAPGVMKEGVSECKWSVAQRTVLHFFAPRFRHLYYISVCNSPFLPWTFCGLSSL